MAVALAILFTHFVADFVFQTNHQATTKSKSIRSLSAHVATYTVGLLALTLILHRFELSDMAWVALNGALHWITDFFTSKLVSRLATRENKHWFFVGIGADQFIHQACLLFTYEMLIGFNG
jgi:hypothetical protein